LSRPKKPTAPSRGANVSVFNSGPRFRPLEVPFPVRLIFPVTPLSDVTRVYTLLSVNQGGGGPAPSRGIAPFIFDRFVVKPLVFTSFSLSPLRAGLPGNPGTKFAYGLIISHVKLNISPLSPVLWKARPASVSFFVCDPDAEPSPDPFFIQGPASRRPCFDPGPCSWSLYELLLVYGRSFLFFSLCAPFSPTPFPRSRISRTFSFFPGVAWLPSPLSQ